VRDQATPSRTPRTSAHLQKRCPRRGRDHHSRRQARSVQQSRGRMPPHGHIHATTAADTTGGIKTRIGEPQRGQGHGPGSEQARKAQADALRRAHLQHIAPEPGRLPFGRPPSLPFRLDGGTGFAPAQAEGAPARATPPTHRPTRRRQSVGVGRRHAGDAAAASMPAGTRPPVSSYTNATDSTRRAGPPTVTHGLGDARLLAAHSLAPAICRGIRL